MAGFEVVVRPAVLPNIRPPAARVLLPPDDPDKGKFEFGGGGGNFIGTSFTFSVSLSAQMPQEETRRVFDTERVYQKDKKGNINKNNFVDVERLKKVRIEGGKDDEEIFKIIYADPPPVDNVEKLETDVFREAPET
jgi:hypothetical protein